MAYARTWVVERAAEKKAGMPPCKDCPDRFPSCAGSCEQYKEWKAKVSEYRREMLKADSGEREAAAYARHSFDRAVKNHESKDVKWGNRNRDHNRYT